jgi:hypothetical protein
MDTGWCRFLGGGKYSFGYGAVGSGWCRFVYRGQYGHSRWIVSGHSRWSCFVSWRQRFGSRWQMDSGGCRYFSNQRIVRPSYGDVWQSSYGRWFQNLLDEGSDVTVRTNVFGAWTAAISLDFNQDFSNDFGVSGVGSTLLDFSRDFSNDFAVYRIGTRITVSGTAVSVGSSIVSIVGAGGQAASLDFNRDFSGDFAVLGVTGAGQGVAESAGSNIAAAVGSWEVIEAPPVYPVPRTGYQTMGSC